MNIVHRLLEETAEAANDGLVRMLCKMVDDLFQHRNFSDTFGFYIASFSRVRNDLGQWRAYADNGRGFALGLAPHLFEAVENPNPQPTEYVVMPVVYGEEIAGHRYRIAIDSAAAIVQANRPHLEDEAVQIPFLRVMANQLIAGQLLGISLATKHEAYRHEQEVRLVMLGTCEAQKPHLETRIRGSEIRPVYRRGNASSGRGRHCRDCSRPRCSCAREECRAQPAEIVRRGAGRPNLQLGGFLTGRFEPRSC